MQYPAANAHPFEFARPLLLLAVVSFVAGFGGYVAVHPAPAALARETVRAAPARAPATVVSAPLADPADRPRRT
jgi:hypothetical protein